MADIVDTAVADGRFTTLVAAVQAAGLVDTLKGAGPFTVFAPTDEAFAKLPAGTVEALLKPRTSRQLKNILLYHVVAGKVMAADVVKLEQRRDRAGQADQPSRSMDGKVMINDASVAATDIETTNGVIHVIDTVLLPPEDRPWRHRRHRRGRWPLHHPGSCRCRPPAWWTRSRAKVPSPSSPPPTRPSPSCPPAPSKTCSSRRTCERSRISCSTTWSLARSWPPTWSS